VGEHGGVDGRTQQHRCGLAIDLHSVRTLPAGITSLRRAKAAPSGEQLILPDGRRKRRLYGMMGA
jgi:hypothetical protein